MLDWFIPEACLVFNKVIHKQVSILFWCIQTNSFKFNDAQIDDFYDISHRTSNDIA